MLIDSHCHLHMINIKKLGITQQEMMQKALDHGVAHLLCVATHPDQIEKMQVWHKKWQVDLSIGLHPSEITQNLKQDLNNIDQQVNRAGIVAIGEIGLDYHVEIIPVDAQKKRFIEQLSIAKKYQKPVIIHSRKAKQDTLNILKHEFGHGTIGVMHCFTEDWDMAKQCLDLGFYISFSGIVTFKNAIDLQEVAKKVPSDRFLIETDAPYLAPIPMRGKINQPAYLKYTAEFVAQLRQTSVDIITIQSSDNYMKLFH